MENKTAAAKCVLLDNSHALLARGILESARDAERLQVRVLDDRIRDVLAHRTIQVVFLLQDSPVRLVRVMENWGDVLLLEPLKDRSPGREIRQNVRVPIRFESFTYPITGKWTGRRKIWSLDLSCGGVSFLSKFLFVPGEEIEVVIPVMADPLIVTCRILRSGPAKSGKRIYAAEFVGLVDEEERRIREAVFNIQIQRKLSPLTEDML